MQNKNIIEQRIDIKGIPTILLTPATYTSLHPTIIFYHGWGSNKESQRFRGFIFASLGYQVVIPDAIYHGERNPINHESRENTEKYFWEVILNNVDESDKMIDEVVEKYGVNSSKIGVVGHSMGGFTASGIFTKNRKINALAVINGSCAWHHTNHIFSRELDLSYSPDNLKNDKRINELDPMNHLDKLVERPILLLHGDQDSLVPIESQRTFYQNIEPMYTKKEKIKFIEYPRLNHYLTTNMMEEIYEFFSNMLV